MKTSVEKAKQHSRLENNLCTMHVFHPELLGHSTLAVLFGQWVVRHLHVEPRSATWHKPAPQEAGDKENSWCQHIPNGCISSASEKI